MGKASEVRVALVTGAAGGIGGATAARLAKAGLHALVTDVNLAAAEAVAGNIRKEGLLASAMRLDVGNAEGIAALFSELDATVGRCDVLVNNAGVASLHSFESFPTDVWHRTLGINVTGPLLLAQHAARRMRSRGWGRIINIASVSGIRAGVGRTAYGTSKAALIGLTRQMAIELAAHGITANAVAPGPIETPLASLHSAAARETFLHRVPMGRYGLPMEVAAAVAFFASEEATYVTGQTLSVDGGYAIAGVMDA